MLRSQMLRRRCIWQDALCMSGYPCMPRRHLHAHTVRQLRHRVGKHGAVDVQMALTRAHAQTTDDRSCQTFGAKDMYGIYMMPTRYCFSSEEGRKSKGV